MNFNERGHAKLSGEFAIAAHFFGGQNRGDQQNGIGAVRGGFNHVIFADGEILAQRRDTGPRIGRLQILEAALEKSLIGKNGKSGRASRFVFGGIAPGESRRSAGLCSGKLS